jgi:hypothetical protein
VNGLFRPGERRAIDPTGPPVLTWQPLAGVVQRQNVSFPS